MPRLGPAARHGPYATMYAGRAWTLRQGSTAVDAAGTIHSDLARGFIRAQVGAVDGEGRGHFGQGRAQPVAREVAAAPVAARDAVDRFREPVQLGEQRGLDDQLLAAPHRLLEVHRLAGERLVRLVRQSPP